MKVTIPYKPRNWAKILHEGKKRWIVLVLHRRAGKSTAVLNHLQRDCIRVPKSQYAFIAPTYKQAKRIGWDIIKNASATIPGIDYNEADLTVKYPTGSKLFLAGSENVDSLRGIPLWGGGQDESSQQPSNLFTEVISKALADHLGYWIWGGTPKGKNEFFRTYQTALKYPEEWTSVFRTIDDSLREEQGDTIENLRVALEDDRRLVEQGLMTQEEFDQEWYCSFEAAIKGAYYAKEISKARREGRITLVPYDPALMVHDVWDLGKGPKMAVGLYQRFGIQPRMIDYVEGEESDGIPQVIAKLQRKPYVYGKHFAPHDIRSTDLSTGKTRLETAEALGWKFEITPEVSVDDGINAGRLFFSRLWISVPNCDRFVDAISQYRQAWDDKRGMFLEQPYHDWTSHPADVHRYASLVEHLMTNEEPIKQPVRIELVTSRYEGTIDPHAPRSDLIPPGALKRM